MPILHEPAVTLADAAIRSVTLPSLEIDVAIRVEKPNIIGVTVREVTYSVQCTSGGAGKEIAHGKTGKIRIPARGSTVVSVPVTSHNLPLIHTLMSFIGKGKISLTITGVAAIDYFLGSWLMAPFFGSQIERPRDPERFSLPFFSVGRVAYVINTPKKKSLEKSSLFVGIQMFLPTMI